MYSHVQINLGQCYLCYLLTSIEVLILAKILFLIKLYLINSSKSLLKPKKEVVPDLFEHDYTYLNLIVVDVFCLRADISKITAHERIQHL
jgi:hypothetical protein